MAADWLLLNANDGAVVESSSVFQASKTVDAAWNSRRPYGAVRRSSSRAVCRAVVGGSAAMLLVWWVVRRLDRADLCG